MEMETRVHKWGNSLALRIPKAFAEEVGIQAQSPVQLELADGRLVVTPISEPGLSLAELLAQITDENLHREVETGPAVGREAW